VEATSAPRPHGLRIPKPRRLLAALPDDRLVEHIRRGEAAAFEVLYDRYSGGILGFCRHMLGSVADAEDAVQHTFIAAHADIQRHEQRELHVKAWLYTIARNRCLSMLRARREQPSEDADEVVTDHLAHDVENRADLRALLADVAKLPDDQREALVLSEIGDLSHTDISRILGCEASKVKSLVFQARTALIDRRVARETPCEEIREQLATLRGGALRRSHLRHHLDACPGCTAYREEVRRQRAMLAIALPVVPSAALKASVLGALGVGGGSAAAAATSGAAGAGVSAAAGGGGAGATGAGAAGGLGVAAQSGLAKLGIVAVLAAGGAGGATIAGNGHLPVLHGAKPKATTVQSHSQVTSTPARTVPAANTTGSSAAATTTTAGARKHKTAGSRRSARGTERGFTPITGQSNGARARDFASTRGKGKEISATNRSTKGRKRTHPVKVKRVKAPKAKTHAAPPAAAPQTPTHTEPAPAPKKTETTTTAPTTTAPQTTPPPTGSADFPDGTTGKTGGNGKNAVGAR
jgi:RNA polymerase sigma factor (sigma-70 family)